MFLGDGQFAALPLFADRAERRRKDADQDLRAPDSGIQGAANGLRSQFESAAAAGGLELSQESLRAQVRGGAGLRRPASPRSVRRCRE